MPFAIAGGICVVAVLLVTYLLWPTWDVEKSSDPSHLPMLIGSVPFIDRIFLSITAHHDALAPDERVRTIYPRYLDSNPARVTDGLSVRPFRDNTPYTSEDLIYSSSPQIVARCTRDGSTPGMCLSERRIQGADLTFRFPRGWLTQWRDVAGAMDQLVTRMQKPRS